MNGFFIISLDPELLGNIFKQLGGIPHIQPLKDVTDEYQDRHSAEKPLELFQVLPNEFYGSFFHISLNLKLTIDKYCNRMMLN
jgi:hypothetical protein